MMNRAGTYWLRPHPHSKTGTQVYGGLAGLFIVSDDEEDSLNLPKGKYDIPIVIQDRTFNSDNQLVYLQYPMEKMNGFLGDQILINGKPNFNLSVSSKAYRFRLLNGSNSRIYKVALSNGMPLTVIGNDGVNDAPALVQADVGIAIGAGTDVAVEAADIVLVKSNPLDVLSIIKLSKATYKKMVQNLIWATGYNAFAIPLAAGVLYNYGILLHPAAGAALMSLSTVIVAINAKMLKIGK